ncbi:MAG: SIR2 family protein [Candidatus Hadarchaeota archaeon]
MLLFLGAGASRIFGIPTMSEFIDIFTKDDEIKSNDMFNDIKNSFPDDFFDLEVLMTVLDDITREAGNLYQIISPHTTKFLMGKEKKEMQRYLEDESIKKVAQELLARLKKMIRERCIQAVRDKNKLIVVYDKFFGAISRAHDRRRVDNYSSGDKKIRYPGGLKIFTTNYDTCVETYLNQRQIHFSEGITRRFGNDVFDIETYPDRPDVVGLYKLHGSIDLFERSGDINQFQVFLPDGKVTSLGEDVGSEFLVYPVEGSTRYALRSPFLDLLHAFRKKLVAEKLWVVVGSSFRDHTICSIMNDVLRSKEEADYPKIALIDLKPEIVLKNIGRGNFGKLKEVISTQLLTSGEFGVEKIFQELEVWLTEALIR